MATKLNDIYNWLDQRDFESREAIVTANFLKGKIEEKAQDYVRITSDDIQRIHLIAVLLKKVENLDASNSCSVRPEEYAAYGDVLSKLRFILDDLKTNRIIDRLDWILGGACFFHVVDIGKFKDFMYDEIRAVLKKVKTGTRDASIGISLEERDDNRMLQQLDHFQKFVERDGFLAFWKNSSVGNELKSYPEEIGRGELMAFLSGLGFFDRGSEFREVHEGAGRSDIVRVEVGGKKRLFEVKVISEDQNRYEEGFTQLFDYMQKENVDTSFYVVLEARPPTKRTTFEPERLKDGKKVLVKRIDIYQIAPTKKK